MSNTYSKMSESAGKLRKRHVDYPKGNPKPTCLIHVPSNPSDKCKVLGDFGSKYAKISPNKDHRHDPTTKKKFNRQHNDNDIVNSLVDKILMRENQKLSSDEGAHENIESNFDEN